MCSSDLYVAPFLHDIAKGRPEDHSLYGATISRRLCPRLGLTPAETETVAWLVENHLVMSSVAQGRDLWARDQDDEIGAHHRRCGWLVEPGADVQDDQVEGVAESGEETLDLVAADLHGALEVAGLGEDGHAALVLEGDASGEIGVHPRGIGQEVVHRARGLQGQEAGDVALVEVEVAEAGAGVGGSTRGDVRSQGCRPTSSLHAEEGHHPWQIGRAHV